MPSAALKGAAGHILSKTKNKKEQQEE